MRYLGNKTKLLCFIDEVLEKYSISGETFVDLFSGTCSVGDHYKDRFHVDANDYMFFAKVLAEAKLQNSKIPTFKKFISKYLVDPFVWFNNQIYQYDEAFFVTNHYAPRGDRMYFTEDNALKIDGIRLDIEELYKDGYLKDNEYYYLLASLLESALRVSNTSGTYQAFFKFWETRATKPFTLSPLEIEEKELCSTTNNAYCKDSNVLAREIEGDIVYIDPPYTITQYANSYHVLETIARYDSPELFGKTGRRKNRTLSGYSNKTAAIVEFEDLFRQLNFEHVLVSYSNQSIIPLDELVNLASLFAVDGEVHVEKYSYREYSTNNQSYKNEGDGLKEAIIYFRKDRRINKSPLNYSGSKDVVLPVIMKHLPKHVGVFVDAMGGAFNVGANVVATSKTIYNELNPYVFGIVDMIVSTQPAQLIDSVTNIVSKFKLEKKGKANYLSLRNHYNDTEKSAINLFTLQIYAFQNMIRFNGSQRMNTPVGNNEFNEGTKQRILDFKIKSPSYEMTQGSYKEIDCSKLDKDTVFYFDPPYFLTSAEYNDGKRGLEGWNLEKEQELLDYLVLLDSKGHKFMLSNVLTHKGKTHNILKNWVDAHGFHLYTIGLTGIKYPRTEILVTNFESLYEGRLNG